MPTTDPDELAERRRGAAAKYADGFRQLPPKWRAKPSPLQEFELLDLPDGRRGLRVVFDFPPESTNNLNKNWVSGGKLVRRMQDSVRWYKYRLVCDLFQRMPRDLFLTGYLANEFHVYMPYRGRGDISNHEKLATDILMITVGNDDTRIDFFSMKRDHDAQRPRIEVTMVQVPTPAYDEAEERRRRREAEAQARAERALPPSGRRRRGSAAA